MKIIELSNKDFIGQTLLNYDNEIVIVLFYVDWCGFCKRFKPVFEELNKFSKISNKNLFKCAKVDCDKEDELVSTYNKFKYGYKIKSYPTIIIYKNNIPVEKYEDERSVEALYDKIYEFQNKKK